MKTFGHYHPAGAALTGILTQDSGALNKNSPDTDSASTEPGPRDTNFLQKYLKQF